MQDGVVVIKVNNIEVGSMPVSKYEEIVASVKKDWRTRVASVFSYANFSWRIIIRLWSCFVQGFTVLIALFMLYSLSHQTEMAQFINELRNLPSEIIAGAIRTITNLCIVVTVISCILRFSLQGVPVFVSASENAINKKIREVMEVPAEGQVSVTFKKDGVCCVR